MKGFCFVSILSLVFVYFTLQILPSEEWFTSEHYKDKKCRHLKPINPNIDLSVLGAERRERFKAVQRAIGHSWQGYTNIVSLDSYWNQGFIPHDDLKPQSIQGHSWLHYGATLHDSIDTLYLANYTKEYEQAVRWSTSYDIQTTSPQATKTFEYSLRILGGLLGAYSISGDPRLFSAAQNAADAILEGPFQASPTIVPRPFNVLAPSVSSFNDCTWIWDWKWKATIQRLYQAAYTAGRNQFTKEHRSNSLAGFGSFGLEFSFISALTGDPKYKKKSDDIFYHVQTYEKNGIIPSSWDVLTGLPISHSGSLGSGSDSFYEYLIKIPVLNSCYYDDGMEMYTDSCTDSDKDHSKLYEKMVRETLTPFHVKRQSIGNDINSTKSQQVFPVDYSNHYDHLLCFLPGMLSLGASSKYPSGSKSLVDNEQHRLARQLLEGCAAIYRRSQTNLSPDTGSFRPGKFNVDDPSFYLRPEYVESLFVIYRLTKDRELQDMAWDVFQSLEKYCKISSGGYAVLKDVNDHKKGHHDDMPSYFLAETLKYLLLIFAPDDYVSLDDFVFTTEAHPLRKLQVNEDVLPLCFLQCRPPTPMPWTLLCFGALIISVYIAMFFVVSNVTRTFLIALVNDKRKTL